MITVVDIRGDKVRLGINAPIEIPVHRQEVYEAITRENLRLVREKNRQAMQAKLPENTLNAQPSPATTGGQKEVKQEEPGATKGTSSKSEEKPTG